MKPAWQRNRDAETRAVEEGHRAFVQQDGSVRVASDSQPGKWYRVTFVGTSDGMIAWSCDPRGEQAYSDDHLHVDSRDGVVPCKHAAVAARRLERERMAMLDVEGRWVLHPAFVPPTPVHTAEDDARARRLLEGM